MLQVTTNSIDQLIALGNAQIRAGRLAEAERTFGTVLAMSPNHGAAHGGLGTVWLLTRRREEAMVAFTRALELSPTPEAFLHLGQLLSQSAKKAEGVEVLRRGMEAFPNDPRIVAECGRALDRNDQPDEAAAVLEKGLQRWPNLPLLAYYYGPSLMFQGKVARAVELMRACVQANPADPAVHSALLFMLHFLPGISAETLLEEHKQWNRRHGALRADAGTFANDRNADRRLRIGYLSPDYKNHGVGRFVAPIFAGHNRERVEVFAYADGTTQDAHTQRISGLADQWRAVQGRTQAQLGQMIRDDRIDILVDLAMHMPLNRMPLFAGRAAPVQVTYLAYCSTTGVAAMDYRLSDPHLDPAGWEMRYVEQTVRLPASWWLYEAPAEAPDVQPRSPEAPITFGCFNNFAKVSPEALELWAQILKTVSGSRLSLHAPTGAAREEFLRRLDALGVVRERVIFYPRVLLSEYFAQYHEIDIALDPFPYSGGTTTCDALWMGVPVVTMSGDLAIGRGSTSILQNIGLPELVARNPKGYVKRAVALASDRTRLAQLRGMLRGFMQSSPLMDRPGFMEGLENAYRGMWRTWCNGPVPAAP